MKEISKFCAPPDPRQTFFDREASGWDTLCEDYTQSDLFHAWFQKCHVRSGDRVLEIGCGTGRVLANLIENTTPIGLAVGLDISRRMLTHSKDRLEEQQRSLNNTPALLIQGEARRLPFPNQSFEHIFILNTFPHLQPREEVLQELYRVLRINGCLHITHFCGRDFINRIHAEAGEEVQEDRLPPAVDLSNRISSLGFQAERMVDREDFYCIKFKRL